MVSKNFDKMFRKSFYQLGILILGFPIMLVVLIKFLSQKKQDAYLKSKAQILHNLQKDGTRDNLALEIKKELQAKLDFFSKTLPKHQFDKQVDFLLNQRMLQLVEEKLSKQVTQINFKKETFSGVFCRSIENNVFLIFSIIFAFPMYLLILIFANPYIKYIFERLLMMVMVIFGVTFLVFTILYFSPLDPAINILGQTATQEQITEFNRIYGLDQPYLVQLWNSFEGLFTFDLGKSFQGNEDVMHAIMRKFPVTLQLTFTSLFIAIILSIPAGIISATKQYSGYDYTFMLLALLGLSIPNFWLGLVLILNFSINLGWLPATYDVANWTSLIMPSIVLGTGLAASVARMTRSSMLEVINQDYITTAKAKGLSHNKVIMKHALGNAMIPIVTVIGLQFGGMLGGSAVTEKVFNVNGLGSYIVDKQFIPDIPIVLAGVVYVAVVISLANLFVDILYAFLDPRIKSKMKSY